MYVLLGCTCMCYWEGHVCLTGEYMSYCGLHVYLTGMYMSYCGLHVCLTGVYMSYCGLHVCLTGVYMYVLLGCMLNLVVGAQSLGVLCYVVHAKSGEGAASIGDITSHSRIQV